MEKVLKLYTYVDGVNDIPFPSEDKQVVTSNFIGDYKRMGGAPSITCSVKHELCLDGLWTYNVYAMFNGERFFIKQIPSSSYDNTDSRYKHDIELVSERIVLDNVYVYDVVDSSSSNDKPVSNSSNFTFFGDIHEFVSRLNESLKYSKVGYSIVVDSGIVSEAKQVSFQDQFFSNAIKECYNTYNIPYYFSGKVIHVGYTDNAITHTFKYGQDESLLSIQKQNANFKIVNRVTGVGSADNIPYYYPNEYESKQEVEANGGTWVNPQTNLMPPIYRESYGSERFYNALNNKYINKNDGGFYDFENEYKVGNPREHIVNFEDIKPSIAGMTNASGVRIDMFEEFAYDEDDNDKTDKSGKDLHPYFYAKLRRFDGDFGFNLFDHSIDESEMVISMTSGSCGSCEFTIIVDESTQKNTVQVDSEGNLVRDNDGNVVFGNPQDEQNDTINNNVWIALKKDIDTFGVIMPNASHNYRPSKGDTFVILHIDLPKAYIVAAEEKLKDELIKYMAFNNSEKFMFSINFSRIFFAERPDILDELNENARIQIEYDGEVHELYVSSFSYSMDNNVPLPYIRVELTDTLTITQNALQNAINSIKDDIFSSYGGGDILKLGLRYFLRKDKDDRSRGLVASDKGFEVGNFVSGMIGGSGSKTYIDGNGKTVLEIDKIESREELIVPTITFNCIDVVSGEQASSFAFGTIKAVDKELQVAELSLLDGQYGTLHTGDFCRGIFHFIEDANSESYDLDHNNFHTYSGFTTSYFKPVEILENRPGHMSFRYELQPNTSVHPEIGMNFFAYGNESDPDRQSITYTTREYKRRLVNVNDWLIVPDRNIAMQDGNLEGLTINGMEMHGYGTYQHNSYFTGVQIQFTNEQLEELRGEGAYVISLSETLGVIKKDDNGNIIYGEYTPPPGVQPSKDYVLQTQVYAYKGSFMLQYSDSEEPGTFKVGIEAVGCEASAENGIVSVSKITDVSSCYVRISAHLEGTATRETTYQILDSPSGSSGEDAVVYSITPATSIISQSTTGSLAPSAITFTSYRTVGASKSESPVYWHVRYSNDGQKWLKYYDTYVESDTFSLSKFNIGKFWQIFTTYGANSESVHLADASVTIVTDGKNGADSTGLASSSLLYNCMQYKENTKYYYNSERRDVVLYQGQVYVVKNFNKDSYIVGFSPTDTTYWQQASKDIFRAMDTALIDKANIGGFMFSAKKTINGIPIGILESQYGPLIIQSVSKELPSISSMTITAKGSYVDYFGSSNSIERSKTLDIVKVVDPSVSVQYKLKPNRREIYEDNEYSLSCVIEYPNSGIELSSLPSVLSMKYKKGSTLYDYTYGSTIDVSDATGYVYFYLYYGSVEIGRITIPIGYVGVLHVDNEVIALACDSDGEVTDSLPVFINPLLTARSTTVAEITSVSFNAPTGVEIAQSRMSLDAETGTLYCNNVDLTGTINANSGLIGDWKIANGSMSTEGTYYGDWITSPFKNTLDVSGMEVAIGSNDITARFGAKKVTFSEDEYQYYCSTLDIVNTQIAENMRTDPMCGIHIKGNKNDLGLFIEGAGIYISPEKGAYSVVRGLAFHARMVSSSTTLLSTDDFVVISGSETVVQLPSAGICPGKVYYIKKLSGTLKVSNVVKAGSTTTTSSESTFDNASRMFISHGGKWYEFYCN